MHSKWMIQSSALSLERPESVLCATVDQVWLFPSFGRSIWCYSKQEPCPDVRESKFWSGWAITPQDMEMWPRMLVMVWLLMAPIITWQPNRMRKAQSLTKRNFYFPDCPSTLGPKLQLTSSPLKIDHSLCISNARGFVHGTVSMIYKSVRSKNMVLVKHHAFSLRKGILWFWFISIHGRTFDNLVKTATNIENHRGKYSKQIKNICRFYSVRSVQKCNKNNIVRYKKFSNCVT